VSMTGKTDRAKVMMSVKRRRRWSAKEKAQIVQETCAPGMLVAPVARRHGAEPDQVFTRRRLYAARALLAVGARKDPVPLRRPKPQARCTP
jgi:transposase